MKRITLAAGAVALVLTLSACGGNPTSATSSSAPQEHIAVKFVEGLAYDAAPIWVGVDKGFFSDEGLDVTSQNAANGVAANVVPLIVGHSYDAGVTTLGVTAQSVAKGLDFRIFTTTSEYADTAKESQIALVGKKDGPKMGELGAGDTVGVPGLGGPAQAYISEAIDKEGGDSSKVTFQNVPITSGYQLVQSGSLTASFITEPALTDVLKGSGDLSIIGYPTVTAGLGGTPATAVGATKEWIASPAASRFQKALDKAVAWVNNKKNYDELCAIIAKHVKTDVATVKAGRLPTFSSTIDTKAVDNYFKIMQKYKVVPGPVTADDIIVTPK